MVKNEINYLIKIMNKEEFDTEYIIDNYEDILSFISSIIKKESIIYSDKSFSDLLDKILKIIFDKLKCTNEISYIESEVLLYSLYYETLNLIELNEFKIEKMKYADPEDEECVKNKKGMFRIEEYAKSGVIFYNINNIRRMCDINYPFIQKIDTMIATCHELIHAKQIDDMLIGKRDLITFLIALEELTNIVTKSKYYDDNYRKTMLELDATLRGKQYLYNFFLAHDLLTKNQLQLLNNTLIGQEDEIIDVCINTEFEAPSVNVENNKTRYNLINVASNYMNKIDNSDEVFEIFKTLEVFYGSEGTPKSLVELLKEREKNKNDNILNKLYEYIIEFVTYDYQVNAYINPCILDKLISTINYLEKKDYKDEIEIKLLDKLEQILYYPGCQPQEQRKMKIKKN